MPQPTTTERTRTIAWEDPVPTAARALEMTGMEYMTAIVNGDVPAPPIALLMGFEPVELAEGRVTFAAQPGEHLYNPIGVVHGGLAATLLDSATGCAVHTTLPAGVAYTTLELKTNFVRAITRDTGRVLCHAEIVHRGGTIATAEGRLIAEDSGKLLAHGMSTCLIKPLPVGRNGNG